MTDIAERLHVVRDHLRTGRFGQREVWEEWLTETADEIERLNKDGADMAAIIRQQGFEIERLRADNERLTALLREAVLYDSQIIHMESWWRKARRALEPKP